MRIAVCMKRVPDSAARVRPAAGGRTIDAADLKFVPSPYDEIALEEALRLKEAMGSGEVVAVALGPEGVQSVLRQALAMGADRAVHVVHPGAMGLELDGLQTARALAGPLRKMSPDMVLFGKLAIDDQSSQVGPLVAAELGLPFVGEVSRLERNGEKLRFHHLVEGQVEVVEVAPPVLASAAKGLNDPRYPGIKGILAAKKKPMETVQAEPGPASMEIIALEPPPPRKPGRIVGEGPEALDELLHLLRHEAKVL